jgi:hypothetical protein
MLSQPFCSPPESTDAQIDLSYLERKDSDANFYFYFYHQSHAYYGISILDRRNVCQTLGECKCELTSSFIVTDIYVTYYRGLISFKFG